MARLPDIPDEQLPAEVQEIAAAQVKQYGRVLNSTRQTAYVPAIARGAAAMSRAFSRAGRVPARLSYLLNLRTAAIIGCPM